MTTEAQTPLVDLLRAVPIGARTIYEHSPVHSSNIPFGRMMHEAADEIERLRQAIEEQEKAGEAQPVAWRIEVNQFATVYEDTDPHKNYSQKWLDSVRGVTPLYAHPSAPSAPPDRLEELTCKLDVLQASKDRCVEILIGIHRLVDPPIIRLEGKAFKFINPHAAEALHELSNRIRAIPDELDAAMSDIPAKVEP